MGREALGEFEHQVLLTLLRLGGEAYSVPVVTELEERTKRAVSPAAVYIALKRLEGKGLLSSRRRHAAPDEGGHERLYFKLRAEGLRRLRASRRTLDRLWDGLDPHFADPTP